MVMTLGDLDPVQWDDPPQRFWQFLPIGLEVREELLPDIYDGIAKLGNVEKATFVFRKHVMLSVDLDALNLPAITPRANILYPKPWLVAVAFAKTVFIL
ncbi:hypothetical protein KD913_04210 [Klebsiella pneumoniae]